MAGGSSRGSIVGRIAFGAALVASLMGSTALAQTAPQVLTSVEPDLGVMDRQRPEYDAKGIPITPFRLFPSFNIAGSYDDNVFRLPGAKSDYLLALSPSVDIKSEWGRHYLELFARSDSYFYSKLTAENLTDWETGGSGRYDISHAAMLTAGGSYGEFHELWSSPDSATFQASPNRYFQAHATTTLTYQPSFLGFSVGGVFDRYDWTDTPLIGGGTLNNSDRNEDKYEGWLRVFYEFSPGYAVFVRATYNDRQFDLGQDRSGIDRASHGYRYDGGVNLLVSHLVRGEIYLGYLKQDFAKNPALPLANVAGFDYGAQLDWFVSPVLTLHLGGNRQLSDTIFADASVEDAKRVDVSADYEVMRNVIAQARASFVATKYSGSAWSDTSYGAGIKVEYLLNRYAAAHVEYGFEHRSSNRTLGSYTDNTISIGLTLHI